MNRRGNLVPATVMAATEPGRRVAISVGPRLLVLVAAGLVFAAAAAVDARWIAAMLGWNLVVALAWIRDHRQLARHDDVTVTRSWTTPLGLLIDAQVAITVHNGSGQPLVVQACDELAAALIATPETIATVVPAHGDATHACRVCPAARGDTSVGDVYLSWRGPLGLAERWARAPLAQTVRVHPALRLAAQEAVRLIRSRQPETPLRRHAQRGLGREFESLREFRDGDELRDVCWTASARRGVLVAKQFHAERSQVVWLVIDTGRLMRARVAGRTKLDHAVHAALMLAQVVDHGGDRLGILAYGRSRVTRLAPGRGPAHLRQVLDLLAVTRDEAAEADHVRAAGTLLDIQARRSLVVWFSDIAESVATPDVVESALRLTPRHLVVFAAMAQPEVVHAASAPAADVAAMYRQAAAREVAGRRELQLRALRHRGIMALDVDPSGVSAAVVNRYLDIKDRNQL